MGVMSLCRCCNESLKGELMRACGSRIHATTKRLAAYVSRCARRYRCAHVVPCIGIWVVKFLGSESGPLSGTNEVSNNSCWTPYWCQKADQKVGYIFGP